VLVKEKTEETSADEYACGRRLAPVRRILEITRQCANVRQAETSRSANTASVSRAPALILLLLRPQESLLNLGEDLVEPLLGAVGSLLIVSYVRLELRDPFFSRTKFVRELLSKIEGVLTVRLGNAGRFVQQTENAATGAVQFIALGGCRGFRGRGKLDHRL
jgi:hypothetical protein